MTPAAPLIGVLALLLLATALGVVLQRRNGRIRRFDGGERLDPADLGAVLGGEALGPQGAVVQFSTEYCARCPGVRRLIAALLDGRRGIGFAHVDLTRDPALAKRFGVLQTPTVLVVDGEGRLRSRLSGPISREALEDSLVPLTGGNDDRDDA